jgi:ABC-type branched-subunit amino acid transport system substrate-binding protein
MPTQAVIKVGTVVATSWPAALLGNSFLKAIQLAKEDLKETTHRFELVIEEITSPEKAEPAVEELTGIAKVNAVVVGFSMSGQIVKRYAAAAKIPLFCICSVGSVGDELYTITTMPLAEDEATLWVAEANRRGIKSIALLTQDYPSIDGHVRALRVEAARAGIGFVYEDRFAATTTDFRSRIAAAKGTAPDVYFVEAFNPVLISSASSSGMQASGTWHRSSRSQQARGRSCSRAAGIRIAMSVLSSGRGLISGIPQVGLPRT